MTETCADAGARRRGRRCWLRHGAAAQRGAGRAVLPALVYRTGAYAPNGIPFANGIVDYLTLVNERDGGINGVKITSRNARPATPPTAASSATSA